MLLGEWYVINCFTHPTLHASVWNPDLALLHSNSFPKTGIQRSFETSIINFMDACTYNKTNDYDVIDSKGMDLVNSVTIITFFKVNHAMLWQKLY